MGPTKLAVQLPGTNVLKVQVPVLATYWPVAGVETVTVLLESVSGAVVTVTTKFPDASIVAIPVPPFTETVTGTPLGSGKVGSGVFTKAEPNNVTEVEPTA